MAYLTRDRASRRPSTWRGFGAAARDPRYGTPAEWEAYHSRLTWRRMEAATGPRADEWARQATWAAAALQTLIAGRPITVRPFPTDPELLALIVNGRSWLLTTPFSELAGLFPGLTRPVLARARRLLLPGAAVPAIVAAKLEADNERLAADVARLTELRVELQRYQKFADDTLKQYQHYMRWFEHHMKKKEKRTATVSAALTAVAAALYWVPVVGWALGLAVDAANVAYQIDQMKRQIAAMQAAGARVQGAVTYVALMESLAQVGTELDNALDLAEWQLWLGRDTLDYLKEEAAGGSPLVSGSAPHSGTTPPAADSAIVRALFGEARRAFGGIARTGRGLWVVAAVAVAGLAALLGRRRG